MARPALEPATKAANRRAAQRRYAEKNVDALRETARARMKRRRAVEKASATGDDGLSEARIRARETAARYRAKNREKIRIADAARRARTSSTPNDAVAKPKPAVSTTSKIASKPKPRPNAKPKPAVSATSKIASKPKPKRPAPAAPIITPPVPANAGIPLLVRGRRRWRGYDPDEEVTENQRRCRALRGAGLEDYDGDSDSDLPPGVCGCDNTMCQREHKNETQNRKDWKRFHLENPDC
ncbi:hypothetical protein C8R46DRAFT_1041102 [Mycena filopes]|nr:hypothetical protein C8R46DRAFT_1041102 [Mycena filopes]